MKAGSLLVVDAVGALVVTASLGMGVWYGLLNTDSASVQIHELSAGVAELDWNLTAAQSDLDALQAARRRLQEELGDRDLLPEQAPVERDLRAISALAGRNRLVLIEFTPAGSLRYPAVLEQRYRLTATGSFADYVRFLGDFEASSSWSDITYLKLASTDPRTGGGKTCELTVSLYSAIREQADEMTTP